MTITIIAAVASNGVIGVANTLPWSIPSDLKHFKRSTIGKTVIMGRLTLESIGKPLKDRNVIVVTRNSDYARPGVTTMTSLRGALASVSDEEEVMVCGGGEIYKEAIALADKLVLTIVEATPEGDVVFPHISADWELLEDDRLPRHRKDDFFTRRQVYIRSKD